jgi:hypothetical protein
MVVRAVANVNLHHSAMRRVMHLIAAPSQHLVRNKNQQAALCNCHIAKTGFAMVENKLPPPIREPANKTIRNRYLLGAVLVFLGVIGLVYIGASLTMDESDLDPAANSPMR